MQLVITVLGNKSPPFLTEILTAVSGCECNILELRLSQLAQSATSYLLVEGNWNHIAKLESIFDSLQKRLKIRIHSLRPESPPQHSKDDKIPYSLETISLDRHNIIENITSFLLTHGVTIQEINASNYQAPYITSSIFSTKFILLIPPEVQLLALREEFLDFCDNLNIDAIIEPIKR